MIMASLKPHAGGPNPWKVALVLEELNVPYTQDIHEFSELKKQPFVNVNPSGRVPAIEDPNTETTVGIWGYSQISRRHIRQGSQDQFSKWNEGLLPC
jgi:glutathione S-transferase